MQTHPLPSMNNFPFLLALDPLLPIRIIAVLALIAVITTFVHVLRHLKAIERTIQADHLVPAQRGPRNNLVLIICAVPIVITTLLLYLIYKA